MATSTPSSTPASTAPLTAARPAPLTDAPRRRKPLRSYWREYVSIAPYFVLFAAFGLIPLGYAVYLSTLSWDGLSDPEFVGGHQWVRLVTSPSVWLAVRNTVAIFVLGQVPVIVGALVGAAMLTAPRLRFRRFYSTAFYLPQVTSLVAVAIVFQSVFSEQFGLVNRILSGLGLPEQTWLSSPWLMKVVIALMIVWRGFGYFLVVFLAGMSSIDTSINEAARVDGAGPLAIFRRITLPLLRPTIVFVALTGTISGFQMFTEPQILFNGTGGPQNGGLTIMLLQFEYLGGVASGSSSVEPDLGFASVIGWLVFAILTVVALLNRRLLRSDGGER